MPVVGIVSYLLFVHDVVVGEVAGGRTVPGVVDEAAFAEGSFEGAAEFGLHEDALETVPVFVVVAIHFVVFVRERTPWMS